MSSFSIDQKALEQLAKDLAFTAEVPAGSESSAIASVQKQAKDHGMTMDAEAARNIVRQAREE